MLTSTGTGPVSELRDHLDEGRASYAYARVTYANDKESKREKFILVVSASLILAVHLAHYYQVWIGPSCKVMRKAKISVHAADVKSSLRVFSIEVAAREKQDLDEEAIVVRLRKAGGASYDGV